jgi:hypothetical protein
VVLLAGPLSEVKRLATDTQTKIGLEGNFLAKNRTHIEKRWPHVWKRMMEHPFPKEVALTYSTPQLTLFVDGVHLTSGYDQTREALLQASLVPEDSPHAWVYGIGLGHIPKILLGRGVLKKMVVVMMNAAVAAQSFAHFDHTDWLADQRVELALAEEEEEIHYPFAAVPSSLQLATDTAARLRDLVFLELATPFMNQKCSAQNSELIERLQENLPFIECDHDVAELFGTHRGRTFLVAAAGPSLGDHYQWIRKSIGQYPLIAVDAALKPLVKEGIHPDIVVTADPNRKVVCSFFEHMQVSPLEKSPLIYFPVVHSSALKMWPGPRFTAYPNHDLYQDLIKRYPKGLLFSSGSVLHPAVDLAVKMGAYNIILLGVDFSFPGGFSHVRGSTPFKKVENQIQNHWVLNGHGKRIPTIPNLRGYLRDLERYIAKHPEVRFINGSKEGAYIEGTSYLENFDQ